MPELSDYLSLVTPYYAQALKFNQTLTALLQPFVDAQAMLAQMLQDFDLDTAQGVQLDILGQWIGRTRYVQQPIAGVYFALHDTPPVPALRDGFDQGVWLGPYDPTTGLVQLDDETYRTLLKLQAIANEWDGTVPSIQAAFARVFPGVVIQDTGDVPGQVMTMSILIAGIQMSSLLLAILQQDFPVKPSGVLLSIIESTVATTPIFGFDLDDQIIGGFDHGSWGQVVLTA
jgi:hypothetical protein